MAIGKTALFSQLSGSAGPLDFRTRRNGKIEIGKKRIPANPNSTRQQEVRAGYGRLHELWQNATYIDKAQYVRLGELYHISAWNAFLLRHQSAMSAAPAGCWGMVESSGSDLHDLTPNENLGTISGATWEELPKSRLSYLSFDGLDDDVNCGHDTSLNFSNAFTMSFWVLFGLLPSESPFSYPRPLSKELSYSFMMHQSLGKLYLRLTDTLFNVHYASISESNLSKTTWQLITGTYDGTTQKIYINDTLYNQTVWSGSLNTTVTDFKIGGRPSKYLDGSIGTTLLLPTALTKTQISQYFNNTKHLYGVYP